MNRKPRTPSDPALYESLRRNIDKFYKFLPEPVKKMLITGDYEEEWMRSRRTGTPWVD